MQPMRMQKQLVMIYVYFDDEPNVTLLLIVQSQPNVERNDTKHADLEI